VFLQMLVVLLLCFCLAGAVSTCTVSSCDDFMRNTAESLSCDSEQSCRDEVARQLALIVPSDSETVFEKRKAVVMAMVRSEVCFNSTVCAFHDGVTNLIATLNEWARVPTSSAKALRLLENLKLEDEGLKNGLCRFPMSEDEVDTYPLNCTFLRSEMT
jgi:hypothetical protein